MATQARLNVNVGTKTAYLEKSDDNVKWVRFGEAIVFEWGRNVFTKTVGDYTIKRSWESIFNGHQFTMTWPANQATCFVGEFDIGTINGQPVNLNPAPMNKGKITMSGKDITRPFSYNGKVVVSLTMNGKKLSLK